MQLIRCLSRLFLKTNIWTTFLFMPSFVLLPLIGYPTPITSIEEHLEDLYPREPMDETLLYIPLIMQPEDIFYVSLDGKDSNPGTLALPWRTIQKAANTLTAGQTVRIRAGTYHEKITPMNSGNANGYITYMASPGETVIVDGNGVSLNPTDYRGDGLVQIIGKSYVKISGMSINNSSRNCVNIYGKTESNPNNYSDNIILSNLNIQNCSSTGILAKFARHLLIEDNDIDKVDYSSGIGVWHSENIIIDNNTITNARYYHYTQGGYEETLTISSVNTFEVKNNTLDFTLPNPYPSNYTADRIGIDVKDSSQNGKVYKNTVQHMSAGGIYIDAYYAGTTQNGTVYPTLNHIEIYQNQVGEGGGIAIGAEVTGGIVEYVSIYNNLIVNASYSGLQIVGAYGDGLRKNIGIFNNTIYGALRAGGNGGAGINITTSHLGSNNNDPPVVIRNNIVMFDFYPGPSGCVGQIVAKNQTVANLVAADHNLVYGPYCISYLPTWCPECREIGQRSVYPPGDVFLDAQNMDFYLKDGSSAIDTGVSISTVQTDFSEVTRPQGSNYDIGAFEFTADRINNNTMPINGEIVAKFVQPIIAWFCVRDLIPKGLQSLWK